MQKRADEWHEVDGEENVEVEYYDLFPSIVTSDGTLIIHHPKAEKINRVIVVSGDDTPRKGFDLKSSNDGWIRCEDRLPEITENGVSDMVLLCWSDGQRTVGAYQGNRTFVGQAWPMAKDCRVTVVAWMPLPDAYEGSDTE